MFEPGDKVRVIGEEDNKVWTVLGYPYKVWHEQAVIVGDAEGREKAVTVNELAKVEEPAGEPGEPGFRCNGDFCEIVREEMRLE